MNFKKEFYIGLLPEQDIFRQRERYKPLAMYLSQKLGIKVELRSAETYGSLIDKIQSRELDAAFMGSFSGAVAQKKLGAQPLARMQYADGTSTYRGLLFVRKDSGIATLQDMKGKTLVLVDKATTAGWLFPLHYFKKNGIDPPFSWPGKTYYAGTHEDAILDVVNNKADIGAAKDKIFYRLAESDKRVLDQLTILATSPPVPANTLLIRQDADPWLKKKLRETLLSMHLDNEGKQALEALSIVKFIVTSAEDYKPVFDYAAEIGLDILKYESYDDSIKH